MQGTLTDCPFCVRVCDHEIIGEHFYPGFGTVTTVKRRPLTKHAKPQRTPRASKPKRWADE